MTAKTRQIPEDVLDVLSRSKVTGNQLALPEQLDRKLYLKTNAVIENLGGKWDRRLKCHAFKFPDVPKRVAGALATGEFVSLDDNGCFFTPKELAERLIDVAEIEPGMTVLEPSAGEGMLALLAAKIVGLANVRCVELLPENVSILWSYHLDTLKADFLKVLPETDKPDGVTWDSRVFDRVVMNPPFARSQDVDHVMHAWKFVKPGGRLVAIMAAGVKFRETGKYIAMREMIRAFSPNRLDGRGYAEDNPDGSFKSSGTNVSTITVTLDKP